MSSNTALTIIDTETKKALTLPYPNHSVSLETAFGKTSYGQVRSFGGLSVQDNAKRVDEALRKTADMQRVWNRSHSQFTWRNLNLSYLGDFKNLRQIAAEVANKRQALNEAKWRQIRNEVKLSRLERELGQLETRIRGDLTGGEKEATEIEDRMLDIQIEIAELKEGMATGLTYIEGAMKDVLALSNLYDEMMAKYEGWTEEDFEREEAKSHLCRSIVQCIRDVRQTGTITKGEQEYLEQLGVNPSSMLIAIRQYLKDETNINTWGIEILHEFVIDAAEKLMAQADVRARLLGFERGPDDSLFWKKD